MPMQRFSLPLNSISYTDGSSAPLGTFFCVGRNYTAHAKEMGASVLDSPVIFIKPPSALLRHDESLLIPSYSKEIHYEVEIVVAVRLMDGKMRIDGVGVGIDFTLRDLQREAKARGEPWAISKGFRGSAAISPLVPIEQLPCRLDELEFSLHRRGQRLQYGQSKEMLWPLAQLLDLTDRFFALQSGDCIFTGTPEGVGEVRSADRLHASLAYDNLLLTELHVEVR